MPTTTTAEDDATSKQHDESANTNTTAEEDQFLLNNNTQDANPITTTPSLLQLWRPIIGWLSFSIVFNVLNTIVFSALYPKILEHIVPDKASYSTAFSVINAITTLASAFTLPFLGSFVDQLAWIKPSLIVSQYAGIFATLALFVLDLLPAEVSVLHLVLNQSCFVVAMFFLRIAVMNNNALLSTFPKQHITALSLASNLIGFSVNMIGLIVLAFVPMDRIMPQIWMGISRENWLLLFYTILSIAFSLFTWLSPASAKKEATTTTTADQRFAWLMTCRDTCSSMLQTVTRAKTDTQYYHCWIFLLSYLFFSTAGTVMTIFLTPFFIAIYSLDLQQEVLLNLYYKIAMVAGVFFGMFLDRIFKLNELLVLALQNVAFGVLVAIVFVCCTVGAPYIATLCIVLIIGFLYSWNTSVARGFFTKLLPKEKACEFMGFYSTFTYLGISLVSALNALIAKLHLPAQSLMVILFFWIVPAYVFFVLLFVSMRKSAAAAANNNLAE